jgi:hypothetical protein
MSFLDGLKTIWNDPEIRRTAITSTVIAVGAATAGTYIATRAATKKQRRQNEEYLDEVNRTEWINGKPYVLDENGNYVPKL